MTAWGNICRICSSPADYEIFAKIPTYLHGSTNEFLNWQKPINVLLEETTGMKNSTDDGLPRYICAPCVSYLKHAVTFREQCIRNALSLKLAELCQEKGALCPDDKENALFTASDLRYVERKPAHNLLLNNQSVRAGKVQKQLLNQMAPQAGEQRIRYLNLLLDKQQQIVRSTEEEEDEEGESTSDENDNEIAGNENGEVALQRKHKNCYNYSETNFEEDDPMEQAQLRDIKVNIPEPMWKERKCPACSKRFMFEESQKSHLDGCVEFQFVTFVAEATKLLEIRRQKMVSPHEFIRRMIFALHKTCTWLQEHSIDSLLAAKLNQVKVSNGVDKPSAPVAEEPLFDFLSGTTTPITTENNVLYAIERSESRGSVCTPTVKKPIPIRGSSLGLSMNLDLGLGLEKERANFLEKLQRATGTPTKGAGQGLVFSARCGQCNLVFDSVSDLEVHNGSHHNEISPDDEAQRRRIIALFEDEI
ncbi:hypothetical protein KR018_012184 [Drosophila ironensis]|nr:hypothetical protein KR018_012184 [Drosophila ironensis]